MRSAWPSCLRFAVRSRPATPQCGTRIGPKKVACSGHRVAACCRRMLAQPPIPLPDRWTLGDLERMRLILRGGSVIDWRRLHFTTREEVDQYLRLCLFEPDDPFDRDRLPRILDEAVDYLRTTFRYVVAEEVAL